MDRDPGSKVTRAFHLYVGHSMSAFVCLLLWILGMIMLKEQAMPWVHFLFFPLGFFIGRATHAHKKVLREERIQRYSPPVVHNNP